MPAIWLLLLRKREQRTSPREVSSYLILERHCFASHTLILVLHTQTLQITFIARELLLDESGRLQALKWVDKSLFPDRGRSVCSVVYLVSLPVGIPDV
jgi:hypothetical protein